MIGDSLGGDCSQLSGTGLNALGACFYAFAMIEFHPLEVRVEAVFGRLH